ncbi:DUF6470 family protein [Falsibacillus albus]|uniref:YviE n=1 Tax=Falsibacillus albus TaxID=2478915 RepID=A0A3L7K1X0_9BACI|nr:DUF6470 family protein [Falsibacillus albus]RLQ96790.1 hypothetical protein D9X91_06735 [Falsibacillus albus]
MSVPQIRMQSQSAKISIQSTPSAQTIEQPKADMEIHQENAKLTMRTTPSQLTIDQSQAWADMNLKSVLRYISDEAQNGSQACLENIAQTSQEGDELMRIENGRGALIAQAERNSEPPQYDYNIGFIPSNFSVKVHFQPGQVNIDAQSQNVDINTQIHKPFINYRPGNVEIGLRQKANLQVDFVNIQ